MYKTLNAAEQAAPAVEARSLLKIYEKNRVVDGIDLTLPVGKVYGILGPNGAGKTTTIKMLTTLLKPDGGIAKIFGHDVQKEANTVRRLIGVTGQYASLDEKLSAYENLFIFSRLLGFSPRGARKKAGYLLAEFDLEDVAARLVEKFSGGMRRRLDLAASLISEPPLLFLDEPTTGLDPRNRAMIWDLIRGLVSKGTTVLLTTQYLDEADQLADRIAVIDRGKVIAEGTSNELKASIGANTLHLRLDGGNNTEKATAIINQILGVKCAVTDDLNISAPMKTPGLVTDLLIAFRNVGIGLSEISVQKPTLDEVFLTITGHSAKEKSGGAI
jgi:ABC-2 type transport system ATP-binding protein